MKVFRFAFSQMDVIGVSTFLVGKAAMMTAAYIAYRLMIGHLMK
mgnify:CR=1 FL=1